MSLARTDVSSASLARNARVARAKRYFSTQIYSFLDARRNGVYGQKKRTEACNYATTDPTVALAHTVPSRYSPKMAPARCTLIANRTRRSILIVQSKPFLSRDRKAGTHTLADESGETQRYHEVASNKAFDIQCGRCFDFSRRGVQLVHLTSGVPSRPKLDTCRIHPT